MISEPTTIEGFARPDARPWPGLEVADGLRAAVRELARASAVLDGADPVLAEWCGAAADLYRHRREELAARVGVCSAVSAAAAQALDDWVLVALDTDTRLRAAETQVREEERAVRAAQAAGAAPAAALAGERWRAAQQAWFGVWHRYRRATQDAAARLRAARDLVPDRPLSLQEQVTGAAGAAWAGVAGAARTGWAYTGRGVTDPGGWWRDVRSLPRRGWAGAKAVVADPVGVARDVVDADAWEHGRWGEGAGVLLGMAVPGPLGKGGRLGRLGAEAVEGAAAERVAGRATAAGRTVGSGSPPEATGRPLTVRPAPPPWRPQSVASLLRGVDLRDIEGMISGTDHAHTLDRHAGVDDEFLRRRVRTGVRTARGAWLERQDVASRFDDVDVAERAITQALRAHEGELRRAAELGMTERDFIRIRWDAGREIGTVMSDDAGVIRVRRARVVIVQLRRTLWGPYVDSAWVR